MLTDGSHRGGGTFGHAVPRSLRRNQQVHGRRPEGASGVQVEFGDQKELGVDARGKERAFFCLLYPRPELPFLVHVLCCAGLFCVDVCVGGAFRNVCRWEADGIDIVIPHVVCVEKREDGVRDEFRGGDSYSNYKSCQYIGSCIGN